MNENDIINFGDLPEVDPQDSDSFLCGRGRISFASLVELLRATIYPEISNYSSSSIVIDETQAGTTYRYGTLSSLTISSVEDSQDEVKIFFSSGDTATTFTYPDSVDIIGDVYILVNTSYAIAIANNVMAVTALNNTTVSQITLQAYDGSDNLLTGETVILRGKIDEGNATTTTR